MFHRSSSFKTSEFFEGYEKHPKVEIVRNPPEWVHVEALLAPKTVPIPSCKPEYKTSWQPPKVENNQYSYQIYRNKNQMIPVYLKETHRGLRKITVVKRIDGNIWELHNELKQLAETTAKKRVVTRVNELSSQIHLRGDFVEVIHDFLLKKGF